jgi:S1-C subfamily serine protease
VTRSDHVTSRRLERTRLGLAAGLLAFIGAFTPPAHAQPPVRDTAQEPAAATQQPPGAQPTAPVPEDAAPMTRPVEDNPAWDRTLERIAPSVVSIEIDQTRAFDTDWNQSSQATGFVVDAERGLILTNRHVVTPGPVVATAVFQNREEVELHAVYRDPVHDFGI